VTRHTKPLSDIQDSTAVNSTRTSVEVCSDRTFLPPAISIDVSSCYPSGTKGRPPTREYPRPHLPEIEDSGSVDWNPYIYVQEPEHSNTDSGSERHSPRSLGVSSSSAQRVTEAGDLQPTAESDNEESYTKPPAYRLSVDEVVHINQENLEADARHSIETRPADLEEPM
jgi:hypothetical protein